MSGLIRIHESPTFVVVDKPSGLLSVPGRGPDKQDCIVNRFKARYPDSIAQPAVHRLDMDTSGLMVLARTETSHRDLSCQFENRAVAKTYLAIVAGRIEAEGGRIALAFRLDPDHRPYQIHDPQRGKLGVTLWRKLQVSGTRTLIEFKPQTGRTHQLRLHAAHERGLGCPIVGDRLYGSGAAPGELKLHATALAFADPETGAPLSFSSSPQVSAGPAGWPAVFREHYPPRYQAGW